MRKCLLQDGSMGGCLKSGNGVAADHAQFSECGGKVRAQPDRDTALLRRITQEVLKLRESGVALGACHRTPNLPSVYDNPYCRQKTRERRRDAPGRSEFLTMQLAP